MLFLALNSTSGGIVFIILLVVVVLLKVLFNTDASDEYKSSDTQARDMKLVLEEERKLWEQERERLVSEKRNLKRERDELKEKHQQRKFIKKMVLGGVVVVVRTLFIELEPSVWELAILVIAMLGFNPGQDIQ